MTDRRRAVVPIFFILWLFFVLVSFFAVQKPFTAANAAAVTGVLLDLLAAAWLTLIALGLGDLLLRRLVPEGLPLLDRLVLGTGLGFGLLGLLCFALGLAGLLRPFPAYAVTLLLSLPALPSLAGLARGLRAAPRPDVPRLPALYGLLVLALTLPLALLPPTDWDGLFYHLTGPKLYLQAGRVAGGIDIPHLSFPSLMEMLFAWAMLLRSDIAAKLLHLVFALLLTGLVFSLTRRFWGRKPAWLAVLALLSMPMVSTLAGWAYNDLALAFYQLAALYSLLLWITRSKCPAVQANSKIQPDSSPFTTGGSLKPEQLHSTFKTQNSALIASGVFAGLAMGLKYTSFVTPLVLAGMVLWLTRRRPVQAVRAAAVFALTAGLAAWPWYVKNWAFTGNPVYPFAFGLFGGQFWDSFRAGWYAAAGTGIGWKPSTLLALPWLATLGIRDMNYWDGRTGPLFLLFLPLVLLALFRPSPPSASQSPHPQSPNPQSPIPNYPISHLPISNLLFLYALAQFGFWTAGVMWSRSLWQSRFLLTCLAALAPLVGTAWAGLARWDLPRFSLSRFVNLAVGVALALTLVDMALLALKIDPLPYLAGLETRDAYLTRRLGAHYAAMEEINQTLPPEAVVQFLWEPRSYYCRRDCRPDSILDVFPHLVHRYRTADAIARAWQAQGVTHVLVHEAGLQFVLNESPDTVDQAVLDDLRQHWLRPVGEVAGAYRLYALEVSP